MAKLKKMYYYTSKGEKKINCYYATIPKDLVEKAKLENSEIIIKIENNKLIIDKK